MIEYLDIVDENDNLTGIIKEKQQAHRDGNYHRTAHIWLLNEKRNFFCREEVPRNHPFPITGTFQLPVISAVAKR